MDISAGSSQDCNLTGIPDECEIAAGTSVDCNSNGRPDECDVVPTVICVDADAQGSANGGCWDDAYTDLQDALAVCGTIPCGSQGVEIWVAAGTYHPAESSALFSRDSAFKLCSNVRLYGGFDPGAGIDEFNERDPETYETILSGDLDDDDATTGTSENSYTVVRGDLVDGLEVNDVRKTLVDGFTIRDGNADDSEADNQLAFGGGIYVNNGTPLFSNCLITDNFAYLGGGGAFIVNSEYAKVTAFESCTFEGNEATHGNGGAVAVKNSPKPVAKGAETVPVQIYWSYFFNNVASGDVTSLTRGAGGAVFAFDGGGVTTRSCVFMNNTADYGGAMAVFSTGANKHTSLNALNCTFTSNHAEYYGGAAELAHETNGNTSSGFENCILFGNTKSGNDPDQIAGVYGTGNSLSLEYNLLQNGIDDIVDTGITWSDVEANSIASAGAASVGDWSATGAFVTSDMSSMSPLSPSSTQGAGYYQYAAVADVRTSAAATSDHLLTFTTGSAGTLTFEGLLTAVEATAQTWTDMPVVATFTVD